MDRALSQLLNRDRASGRLGGYEVLGEASLGLPHLGSHPKRVPKTELRGRHIAPDRRAVKTSFKRLPSHGRQSTPEGRGTGSRVIVITAAFYLCAPTLVALLKMGIYAACQAERSIFENFSFMLRQFVIVTRVRARREPLLLTIDDRVLFEMNRRNC